MASTMAQTAARKKPLEVSPVSSGKINSLRDILKDPRFVARFKDAIAGFIVNDVELSAHAHISGVTSPGKAETLYRDWIGTNIANRIIGEQMSLQFYQGRLSAVDEIVNNTDEDNDDYYTAMSIVNRIGNLSREKIAAVNAALTKLESH